MYKRRSFRRRSGPRRSPYEMQQFSYTRTEIRMTEGSYSPVFPFQFLTCIVSPREEHATIYDAADSPPVPADAMGCVVGGIRFYLRFDATMWRGNDTAPPVSSVLMIKSAFVVLPLDPIKAQTPLLSPITPNLLSQQGTQVADPVGLPTTTYQRPRILWRGLDALRFTAKTFEPAFGGVPVIAPYTMSDVMAGIQFSEQASELKVVKSKVRLGMDQALFMLHEISPGFDINENQNVVIETTLFGVAAVKRLSRGQGSAK